MTRSTRRFIVFVAASVMAFVMAFVEACAVGLALAGGGLAADTLSFNKDIRSIMV
jgi:hypothetical protein